MPMPLELKPTQSAASYDHPSPATLPRNHVIGKRIFLPDKYEYHVDSPLHERIRLQEEPVRLQEEKTSSGIARKTPTPVMINGLVSVNLHGSWNQTELAEQR